MSDTTTETTMPGATARCTTAIPCFSFADAHAAIDWLVRVLGAEARHVYPGPDGTVAHAELWFGDACVMCGSLKTGGLPPSVAGQGTVYIVVRDPASVDAIHARAVEHGATIAISLRDTDYGSHEFGVLDPEGNYWGFGTYAPA